MYLAQPSETRQVTLSSQLSSLILATLRTWEGPPPRLCYVTDAGDAESQYYRRELRRLRDPRRPDRRLRWIRIVDYYHVSERIATLADCLNFASARDAHAWRVRMCKLLKKPSGVGRVLHSAAALASYLGLRPSRQRDFDRARNYLRRQRRFLNYHEYQRLGLPIGSGVTEAACKTVFTQRLKLSGMQWTRHGAEVILRLRTVLLSGIWSDSYKSFIATYNSSPIKVYDIPHHSTSRQAA